MQPCLDDFNTTFDDYGEMQVYHARQTRESKWERKTVSGLHIEPLDEASPLYTDDKAFAPDVSQVAVSDTAKNLGLALLTEDGLKVVYDPEELGPYAAGSQEFLVSYDLLSGEWGAWGGPQDW